jgi:uncharacterized membrane protein
MIRVRHIVAILTGLLLGGAGPDRGPDRMPCAYEALVVPYPLNVVGTDINNRSEACGFHFLFSSYEQARPFYWSAKTGIVTLPLPPGYITGEAYGISEEGDIVGIVRSQSFGTYPALWRDGTVQLLPTPTPGYGGEARGVAGKTAAGYWGAPVSGLYAIRWDAGAVSGLNLPVGPYSEAWAVAAGPLITGWMGESWVAASVAFLFDDDGAIDLDTIPGGTSGRGVAVTPTGHVAMTGRIVIDGIVRVHSSLWQDGRYTDPGTLPGCHSTRIEDVNALGAMVGVAQADVFGPGGPILWHKGIMRRIHEMNLDSPHDLNPAYCINDRWELTGGNASSGEFVVLLPVFGSPADINGDCHAGWQELLMLLNDWGLPESPVDYDRSGIVDVLDLLFLLANWG